MAQCLKSCVDLSHFVACLLHGRRFSYQMVRVKEDVKYWQASVHFYFLDWFKRALHRSAIVNVGGLRFAYCFTMFVCTFETQRKTLEVSFRLEPSELMLRMRNPAHRVLA